MARAVDDRVVGGGVRDRVGGAVAAHELGVCVERVRLGRERLRQRPRGAGEDLPQRGHPREGVVPPQDCGRVEPAQVERLEVHGAVEEELYAHGVDVRPAVEGYRGRLGVVVPVVHGEALDAGEVGGEGHARDGVAQAVPRHGPERLVPRVRAERPRGGDGAVAV